MKKIDALLNYFEKNADVFEEIIEDLDSYNGYLYEDRYYSMDELDDLLCGRSATEILNQIDMDNFDLNDDFCKVGPYGISSATDKDYSDFLDTYFIDELLDNYQYLDTVTNNQDLMELIEEAV